MKKTFLGVFLTVLLSFPLAAYDYPSDLNGGGSVRGGRYSSVRPYVRADAGMTYSSFEVGPGEDLTGLQFIGNFALGAEYKRSRLELAYQPREAVSDVIYMLIDTYASVSGDVFMVNYFYDFFYAKYFDLYIGAGAGVDCWDSVSRASFSGAEEVKKKGESFLGALYLGMSFNIPTQYLVTSIDMGIDYYYERHFKMNNIAPKVGLRLTF